MKKRKNEVKVIWDEPNRQRHLEKHGVDFLDASLMFLKDTLTWSSQTIRQRESPDAVPRRS